MFHRVIRRLPAAALVLLSACGLTRCAPEPVDKATIEHLYSQKLTPSNRPLAIYFIGHSLVGQRMPALLAQFAPAGHRWDSQSGWGAELQAHWEPNIALSGAEVENDHAHFRDAHEATKSGDYDVLVLTEKIGLEASIKYHDSWYYVARWSEQAWQANPETRVYIYETWHGTDVDGGWMTRVDRDLPLLWELEIIDRALANTGATRPIYVIPGGQVMARFLREAQVRGGIGGIATPEDLLPDGIHKSDAAEYLIALTHYAVIYGRSPVGLRHEGLLTENGEPFEAPDAETARLMQEVVWEVVTSYIRTGVTGS